MTKIIEDLITQDQNETSSYKLKTSFCENSLNLNMQAWIKITFILCAFGTLREIRPSEPFVTEFLSGKWRNVTMDQLNREVYPVGTYSYLTQLVLVFLITDFLRFKPVIILSGFSGISVYAVLLWTTSLQWLQVSQFLYGLYMATEVAYLTYIYAKVEPDKYPKVSSYTRIGALTGRFLSGVTSQLLIHYEVMDYRELNYITFSGIHPFVVNLPPARTTRFSSSFIVRTIKDWNHLPASVFPVTYDVEVFKRIILATCWAFLLPAVPFGIYFHRNTAANVDRTPIKSPPVASTPLQSLQRSLHANVLDACTLVAKHSRAAYSRGDVLAWSALYACALALFVQAQNYVQVLWSKIQEESNSPIAYNGAVEAIQTLLGALGAFIASSYAHAWTPAPAAAIQAVAVLLGTRVPNVFVSYAGYIVMGMLFHYTITLASAKIAGKLSDDSCFGLIFGINTLLGTGLQSILTLILIQAVPLSIHLQFYSISGLFLALSLCWLLGWIVYVCRQRQSVSSDRRLYETDGVNRKIAKEPQKTGVDCVSI